MSSSTLLCPNCGEPAQAGSHFCESCGARLEGSAPSVASRPTSVDPTSCRCGASAENRDQDGFCLFCGRKFEPRDPRDHLEESPDSRLAAVTDRGNRHKRNEDAFSIALTAEGAVLVVCDGVSSASNSNIASEAAAIAARSELTTALKGAESLRVAMARAVFKAHAAACEVPMGNDGRPDPPGATIVAAVFTPNLISVAWSGDSRAYWLSAGQSKQLTKDHSWMQEAIDSGQMSCEAAAKDLRAHAITQCIGALNDGPPEPGFAEFQVTTPGYLLLCTDGLWGYEGNPETLLSMLGSAEPLEGSRAFVQFAIDRGGIDNITTAILQISPL